MPKVSSYAAAPNKWNFAMLMSAGGILWSLAAFWVGVQLDNHSASSTAHPVMASQVQDIRSDQLKGQIMNMDKLICESPGNNYYREEIVRLISLWEDINEPKQFPNQLLRCGKQE